MKTQTIKTLVSLLIWLLMVEVSVGQTVQDIVQASDVKFSWLGIDYSRVKLIGDFSQFASAGEKSTWQIRDEYFPGWNNLVLSEPNKYDIKGMLRKGELTNDIGMIMSLNAAARTEEMEAYNNPVYTIEDVTGFIASYDLTGREGIGILLIAECLNKNGTEAYYHFVAINLSNKQILIHERLRGQPQGFGLRNYWAGSIYDVIKQLTNTHYPRWKREFKR